MARPKPRPARPSAMDNDSGRNPQKHVGGSIFPAARQGQAITASVYFADDGGHRYGYHKAGKPRFADAGRDTVADGGRRAQWSDAWGMAGAELTFRNRWMQTLNLGKFIRPRIGAMMDGRTDMRPTAIAIPPRSFGNPLPVSVLPGGRMVAPGRVTRWQQASNIWPTMGKQD
jgi:hypothetical protein